MHKGEFDYKEQEKQNEGVTDLCQYYGYFHTKTDKYLLLRQFKISVKHFSSHLAFGHTHHMGCLTVVTQGRAGLDSVVPPSVKDLRPR